MLKTVAISLFIVYLLLAIITILDILFLILTAAIVFKMSKAIFYAEDSRFAVEKERYENISN